MIKKKSITGPSMRIFYISLILISILSGELLATRYYVSTSGNDLNNGSFEKPFATLSKAASSAIAGDTIFIRGGVYSHNSTISLGSASKSGTANNYYYVLAYPGEKPIFDFSKQTSSDGIKLNGNYWYVKGVEVRYSVHNGIAVNGSYNIIENCIVHDNKNTGMQFGNGASYNKVLNCDSYNNYDPPSGGNADGFAPKLDVGTGNYFYGCRAWQNSDDGWDGYLRPADNVTTIIENCWSFMNGYLKDGSPILTGNGNGFKMGGGDSSNKDSLRHNVTIKNSLCFDNRVKGYDQNNDRGSMTIINCTGFRNGSFNFSIPGIFRVTSSASVKNCISYLSPGVTFISRVEQSNNSWLSGYNVTASDFLSLDTTGVRGPRKADGSLPDLKFLRLSASSGLIDVGTEVGLPFKGKAPDLGAYEYDAMFTSTDKKEIPVSFNLEQNFPNPFNPNTVISYQIPEACFVILKVYDVVGKEVATLVNKYQLQGKYIAEFNALHSLFSSGVYFYRLFAGENIYTKKMILIK